ncbi:ATP-binding protein [Xylanimonas protaetiae]|uniref:ATP-binding protein n=1 Tax=Xylanimonas protaetiae TaxID=2509457 RepID=A0A4P6F757_9MICO|nr:ATP-binding protein [Xylanimonas protaetiae]QAY69067.1 ATP-binding protein [Xylanimonas protaetiae]
MSGESRYVLEGFAVPAQLEKVHRLLERAGADHPDVDPTDLMLFETAVIEIANNVVEHGRPAGEVRWRLTLKVSDAQIEAELDDTGQEFTPGLDAVMPGEDAESGRGLALAGAVLDMIELERAGGENHWRMVRRLAPPPGR